MVIDGSAKLAALDRLTLPIWSGITVDIRLSVLITHLAILAALIAFAAYIFSPRASVRVREKARRMLGYCAGVLLIAFTYVVVTSPPSPDKPQSDSLSSSSGHSEDGKPVGSDHAHSAESELSVYLGKYPFDKVHGVTFWKQPAVRKLVHLMIDDGSIRRTILAGGVEPKIISDDGKIRAAACEPHNCGDHNWSISISPDGSDGSVCYHDADNDAQDGWYSGSGTKPSGGNCFPTEADQVANP